MGEVMQEAAPYPRELVRTVTLKDGFATRIRPIRADDEPRLVDLYERLSRHTAYQRFFTVLRRLPNDWYHSFANVDYVRRMALVAERETVAAAQLIGVGRYEPSEEPDLAEVAFVVEDGWQGRGLGAILLEAVLAAADARGIRRFRADVQADNHRMLRLLNTRTQVEDRRTQEGVTGVLFRRVPADATPR
ncbi:MAG TPA: GNAT family N-acetyltransferase [Candidatus Limnocylindria bacterium]|nr:GNAT family N-acetyltransferase [Candidatus Limnocylindria bacterium]